MKGPSIAASLLFGQPDCARSSTESGRSGRRGDRNDSRPRRGRRSGPAAAKGGVVRAGRPARRRVPSAGRGPVWRNRHRRQVRVRRLRARSATTIAAYQDSHRTSAERGPGRNGLVDKPVELRAGEALDRSRLTLKRGGVIYRPGRRRIRRAGIRSPGGRCQARAVNGSRDLQKTNFASTDDLGEFRMFGVAPGQDRREGDVAPRVGMPVDPSHRTAPVTRRRSFPAR